MESKEQIERQQADQDLFDQTIAFFSVDFNELMCKVLPGENWKKDESLYKQVIQSLNQVKLCKEKMKNDEFDKAVQQASNAFYGINDLVASRADQKDILEIILAPFYYILGNAITTYIETNTDEFGNLKPLNYESEDNEDEEEDDDEEEDEVNEINGKHKEQNSILQNHTEVIVSPPQEDEPRIEEEKIDTNQNLLKSDDNEERVNSLYEDANSHLSTGIQVVEDFINIITGPINQQTKEIVVCNLLIDLYNRRAELFQFREVYEFSNEDFSKVVALCQQFPYKNERMLAGALFNIGNNLLMEQKPQEAGPLFLKAAEVFRFLLLQRYKELGREFEDKEQQTHEKLVLDSAYDNTDEIKEIKSLYREIIEKIEETDKSDENYDKMKEERQKQERMAQEEKDLERQFTMPVQDPSKFVDVTQNIRKKRTSTEAFGTTTSEDAEVKRRKLDEDQNKDRKSSQQEEVNQ